MMQARENHEQDDERKLAEWLREAGTVEHADSANLFTRAGSSGDAESLARVRAALLARVAEEQLPRGSVVRAGEPPRGRWQGLRSMVARHRIAAGGIGLSSLIAVLLAIAALNSGQRLSAMEQVAKELREVSSYSFRLHWESTWTDEDGRRQITSQGDSENYWRAPDAFHSEMTIKRTEKELPDGKAVEKTIEHFAEIFPVGQPGLFIDYLRKTYIRSEFQPIGSRTYPWDTLRMVREGSYDLVRELGSKRLGDVKALGFVIQLKNGHDKAMVKDPVELWVDAETHLPIEFSYHGENADSTYRDLASNFHWNIPLDDKLFVATPPAGFDDITPPEDEQSFGEIARALRLYAELSGGHYPRVKKIDAAAVLEEMKKLAGFAGPLQEAWKSDKRFQQIEQSKRGLEIIARVQRLRFLTGYRGKAVGPSDKDQVLLWWSTTDNRYRVFYGDLRTAVVSEAEWSKLVPDAEAEAKEEADKPGAE